MGKAGVNICAHARTHMHVSQESQGGEKKSLLNPTFCNDDILQNVFKSREVRLHNTLTQMVGFTSMPSISPLPRLHLNVYRSMKCSCLCTLPR